MSNKAPKPLILLAGFIKAWLASDKRKVSHLYLNSSLPKDKAYHVVKTERDPTLWEIEQIACAMDMGPLELLVHAYYEGERATEMARLLSLVEGLDAGLIRTVANVARDADRSRSDDAKGGARKGSF